MVDIGGVSIAAQARGVVKEYELQVSTCSRAENSGFHASYLRPFTRNFTYTTPASPL